LPLPLGTPMTRIGKLWLGVTAEDNRLAPALELLRQTKDQVGEFTAFASVEPITAPADKLDFAGIDWVLSGESGPKARPMQFDWLEDVHERILAAGIPLYFKQYGHAQNHPAARIWPDLTPAQALLKAVEQGLERAPRKNGGATYKGRIIQEKPAGYYRLKQSINNEEWNSHP
jgi:hypothetical protein